MPSDKSSSKVSVIMAAFCSSKYINCAIKSIRSQTYKNWELIVICVKNDEATINVVKKFLTDKRIKLILSDYARFTHQINLGFYETSGKYVMMFDSDDFLYPYAMTKLVAAAKKKNLVIVYPTFRNSDAFLKTKWRYEIPKFDLKELKKGCFIVCSSLVKRKAMDKAMPMLFEEGRLAVHKLWIRIASIPGYGKRIKPLDIATFIYRKHNKNISKTQEENEDNFVVASLLTKECSKYLVSYFCPIYDLNSLSRKYYAVLLDNPQLIKDNYDKLLFKRILLLCDGNSDYSLLDGYDRIHYITKNENTAKEIKKDCRSSNVIYCKNNDEIIDYIKDERYNF